MPGNGGAVPQNFTNAIASGAQGVSLRGLTTTVVLFDGLRSFVDLNTNQSATVDRVEVLRDGASSTYGADAIAGVVNDASCVAGGGFTGRNGSSASPRRPPPPRRAQPWP